MISLDKFALVTEYAPLVSIDFIVENEKGEVLLGERVNKPALGYYFTPGGRIFKDEPIADAIKRLSAKELNYELDSDMLTFLGVYEHFYAESYVSDAVSTHYVVLAYRVRLKKPLTLSEEEHSSYRYFERSLLLADTRVHPYVKEYFKEG
jgi:colanic acid biosynthesis protein WcaH